MVLYTPDISSILDPMNVEITIYLMTLHVKNPIILKMTKLIPLNAVLICG